MVQGLRSLDEGFVPEVFDSSAIDGRFLVTTAESIEALRRLTSTEGIFAGVSAGGVLVVASRIAEQMESGTIVALLAGGGSRLCPCGAASGRRCIDLRRAAAGGHRCRAGRRAQRGVRPAGQRPLL